MFLAPGLLLPLLLFARSVNFAGHHSCGYGCGCSLLIFAAVLFLFCASFLWPGTHELTLSQKTVGTAPPLFSAPCLPPSQEINKALLMGSRLYITAIVVTLPLCLANGAL